jgi:hypothetical protein
MANPNYGQKSIDDATCCNHEIYGSRAVIESPGYNFTVPDQELALMTVGAQGSGYNHYGTWMSLGFVQLGYAQTNGISMPYRGFAGCDSGNQLVEFTEVGWNSSLLDGAIYECQFYNTIGYSVQYHRFSALQRDTADRDDWSAYMDSTRVYDNEDLFDAGAPSTTVQAFVGGEFNNCSGCGSLATACLAQGGYGVNGTLAWQRATAPQFYSYYTIGSATNENDDQQWSIGDITDSGFYISHPQC